MTRASVCSLEVGTLPLRRFMLHADVRVVLVVLVVLVVVVSFPLRLHCRSEG